MARPKKSAARKTGRRARRPLRRERAAVAAAEAEATPRSEFELSNEQIETALQTGEHAGLLEDYFGPEHYQELAELARDTAARAVRGGPPTLILPGLMGTKLGRKRLSIFDDVYWFDPIDVAVGRLTDLALPAGRRLDTLGVMLHAYLKLKLRLRRAGYDADFYAFDWRLGIEELGAQLVATLKKRGGAEVNLIAHSMGGLVARWALEHGGTCRRLVMLGTPNFGSFAPVQALRASYPVVRKLGVLDVKHSAEELVRGVFSTFPGLTQMLPWADRFGEVDLYDLTSWPDGGDGLRPRKEILDGVKKVHDGLGSGRDTYFVIAGVDHETTVGLTRDESGSFVYQRSPAGDGTVPLEFATLPGAKAHYYVVEKHGSLPNNQVVARAVLDLLDRGRTDVLPDSYAPAERRAQVRNVPEDELRRDPYENRGGGMLSQRELRHLLDEVASPDARDDAPIPAARPVLAAGRPAVQAGYRHPFDHVVVGRRRQHRIDLRFALGSITEVDARALALGVFRDVAPSGAAGALDAQLGGAITELTRRRMFSRNVGEIFVMPTGRHPIRADLITFVGLGAFDRFNEEVLQTAAENVIRTFVNTRVEEFATVLFGAGSGQSPANALRNLLTGFFGGLRDADRDHHFRRLIVCENNQERYVELKEELYRLSSTALCQDVEITFDEITLRPSWESAGVSTRQVQREDPVYLIVRQEGAEDATGFSVRSSVLTAGAKATVVTGVRTVRSSDFKKQRDATVAEALQDFTTVGQELGSLLLADEVRAVLPSQRSRHLVIVHDASMSRVPWETLAFAPADGGDVWFPSAIQGMSRRYAADNLSVAKWLEERIEDNILSVLLVVNPTEDLAGADREGERIRTLFAGLPGCRIDQLARADATRPALLAAFGSGEYDIIHYAGHAQFNETNPEQSGIICANDVTLSGVDLAGLSNLPTLVFFNACESGRLRKRDGGQIPERERRTKKTRIQHLNDAVGLAEAFMRGGVANFIGTYWPVGDAAADLFASAFYTEVLKGKTLGESVQAGRGVVSTIPSKDWANYIVYGNPDFVLKEAQRRNLPGAPVGTDR